MRLWWLFIGGAVIFGLIPFGMVPPEQAVGELYWTIPAGIVTAAAAFKAYAFFEAHGIDGPGGTNLEATNDD